MLVPVQLILTTCTTWTLASAGSLNLVPCMQSVSKVMSSDEVEHSGTYPKSDGDQRDRLPDIRTRCQRSCHLLGKWTWSRPSSCSPTTCSQTWSTLVSSRTTACAEARTPPVAATPVACPVAGDVGANNTAIQQLCKALVYAVTMAQQWQAVSASATNSSSCRWPRRRWPKKNIVTTRRFEWLTSCSPRPANGYKDPIVAQETSRVDYPNAYPMDLGAKDEANAASNNGNDKWYDEDDADKPATVWKVNVVGERMSKPAANNGHTQDDNDEDDEDTAAVMLTHA